MLHQVWTPTPARLSAARSAARPWHLRSLCTRETDACGCNKAFSGNGTKLFTPLPTTRRLCTLLSQSLGVAACFLYSYSSPKHCFVFRGPDRTPVEPRMVSCLGPGSSLSWLQSGAHLEPSTTCTLTLLFIVVNKANIIWATLILVPFCYC